MWTYNSLAMSIVSYSIISYLNGLVALNMINPLIKLPSLPDQGFIIFPHISACYPNMMLVFFCAYFAIRFFRRSNVEQLIKLIWCITILFTIRLITFTVTIVPPSTVGCINRDQNSPIEWNVVSYLIYSDDNTCIDYMFSGHACYFVILGLFSIQLTRYVAEKIVCTLYVLLGLMSIISGHIHYTVDVVVAIVMTSGCYILVNDHK
jgi:hypothetical protein